MLIQFLKQLEKRVPIEPLLSHFPDLFTRDVSHHPTFSDSGFNDLLHFLAEGEASFQSVAVQAAVKWSNSGQRVFLRNAMIQRGLLTPSCLWAYKKLRGNPEELFKRYASPEITLMQILLLQENEPARAIPFLIEHVLDRTNISNELRIASALCVMRLLDSGVSPELLRSLRDRYPTTDVLQQWRPGIPGRNAEINLAHDPQPVDFHQLVRSVVDIEEFSSLTRTIYLLTLFYVPLTEKEWRSLWLTPADQIFFRRLRSASMLVASNGGFLLSTDTAKQAMAKKFLYQSYALAKDSVHRLRAQRVKEDRQKRVRNRELDRQALEMISEGIICVDPYGYLYYMNPAAESLLTNKQLRERLFGSGPLEEALRTYSRGSVLARIRASSTENGDCAEVFGSRVAINASGKRFDVELGTQVILLRDSTDRYLIDNEIGKLYRHELKATLDVMAAGLDMTRQLVAQGLSDEALPCLDQLEQKRAELCSMLEERIDFIRLHSDAFQIRSLKVNLNMVVDRCVSNYREAAGGKNISIKSNHLDEPAITVLAEERFLTKALDNIIRNAVRFCHRGGEIGISTGIEKTVAFVEVSDNGPGIARENLEKIFELGFTTGGSGRGLYIAKRIALAHGGSIGVRSDQGHGACFTFRLPLAGEET
ncbi:MAG TPA: HAMP domain-containing sensor histidine kinase [Desulfomonilaceae bacterium]|nr:HAMP domain-containing sensor histidine kinase [Desulfomonilaceae bacterium]